MASPSDFEANLDALIKQSVIIDDIAAICTAKRYELAALQAKKTDAQDKYATAEAPYIAAKAALKVARKAADKCTIEYGDYNELYSPLHEQIQCIVNHAQFQRLLAERDPDAIIVVALINSKYLSNLAYTDTLYKVICIHAKKLQLLPVSPLASLTPAPPQSSQIDDVVTREKSSLNTELPLNTPVSSTLLSDATVSTAARICIDIVKNSYDRYIAFNNDDEFACLINCKLYLRARITIMNDVAATACPPPSRFYKHDNNKQFQWYRANRHQSFELCKKIVSACSDIVCMLHAVQYNTIDLIVYQVGSMKFVKMSGIIHHVGRLVCYSSDITDANYSIMHDNIAHWIAAAEQISLEAAK